MTRKTIARVAGVTFLVYIVVSIAGMVLFSRSTAGEVISEKLASIAGHTTDMGIVALLSFLGCVCALILAVTLYSLTRAENHEIAMLAMVCRVAEGVITAVSISATPSLLWLASVTAGNASDVTAVHRLGAHLLREDMALSGSFFAVGSLLFCYLFLRGRMIPVVLAWLGVIASLLLLVVLPLQLAGFLVGPITSQIWLPMIVFEVLFALWLIIKGVTPPVKAGSA